jgi:hypothetical protein
MGHFLPLSVTPFGALSDQPSCLALAAPLSRTVPGLCTMTFFMPSPFIAFRIDHHYYHSLSENESRKANFPEGRDVSLQMGQLPHRKFSHSEASIIYFLC